MGKLNHDWAQITLSQLRACRHGPESAHKRDLGAQVGFKIVVESNF
jgi:hypothetical protein